MQFNVKKPAPHIIKRQKREAKLKWHQKFAWLPVKVDLTDDGYKKVWMEKFWQKGKTGPQHPSDNGDGIYFHHDQKFSNKEYFRKKLAGDFEKRKLSEAEEDNVAYSNQAPSPGTVYKVDRGDGGHIKSITSQDFADNIFKQIEKEYKK